MTSACHDREIFPSPEMKGFAEALGFVARLHDREPDAALIHGMRESQVIEWLAGMLKSSPANRAIKQFDMALRQMPESIDDCLLDDLAAEFADIYLNHSYRIAPIGSVWLTEDKLACQEPMFAVRKWYAHYGVEVPNWRLRADDHIVNELLFLAHLCQIPDSFAVRDTARFLDEQVLTWVPSFSKKLSERARLPYFIAVGALTDALLEELRAYLCDGKGLERPPAAEEPAAITGAAPSADSEPYLPGLAEGW